MIFYCIVKIFRLFSTFLFLQNNIKTIPSIDMLSYTSTKDNVLPKTSSIIRTDIQTSNVLAKRSPTGKTLQPMSERTITSSNGELRGTPAVSGQPLVPQAPVKKRKNFFYPRSRATQFLMRATSTIGWIKCSQCNRLHRSNQGALINLYCPYRYTNGFQRAICTLLFPPL